ncbi:hypothetical protein [Mycolicibacterium septicum]|uniref:hypothetical protein n=1 Tax=Mycolicibacterium septicum TaxID=98668 RepID=UPI002362C65A|nr:hypothetical protein [Mycolicibacterium septicum]
MTTVWASVVAVAGTLLGACLTYVFQLRSAERTIQSNRAEQRRKELAAAAAAYAAAASELCRAEYDRGIKRINNVQDESRGEARQLTYRLRTQTRSAYYLVRLLADPVTDHDVINAAQAVMDKAKMISVNTFNATDMQQRDADAANAIETFVDIVNRRLGQEPSSSPECR